MSQQLPPNRPLPRNAKGLIAIIWELCSDELKELKAKGISDRAGAPSSLETLDVRL